jgi:hypothetical protein
MFGFAEVYVTTPGELVVSNCTKLGSQIILLIFDANDVVGAVVARVVNELDLDIVTQAIFPRVSFCATCPVVIIL